MKKMLINATRSEELRVAITDAQTQNLLDVIVERQSYRTTVGNIYLAKVSSIEKSLGAAFINFGSERHGFLPMKEISKEYFEQDVDLSGNERPNIKQLIKEGQYLMVQVEKEERGNKGAALTTFISLAGSYLVLMPNNPRAGGISRRVEGDDRNELRDTIANLPLPEGMGLIVRTAGVGKSEEELKWDLNNLLKQWHAIKAASLESEPPFFIHQESDIVTRIIRDYLREDFNEIIIDNEALYEKVKAHLKQVRPDFVDKVKLFTNSTPIFNHFQIEQKIESAYQREVQLSSGGSIVIDHTEALVAIDVNSARATKGSNIEETALTTNMEAAEEIARQLRLRDIGGLVVIDFIDMSSTRNRRDVENNLRNALKLDKARTQIGNVSSRFGLLEMSRQRLRHSLGEATQVTCPRCSGWGTIRSIESLSLSIIRMIEDDAVKANTGQIQAQLPIDISTFILNEKREMVTDIEKRHSVEVLIIPNSNLESPHYHIKRLTHSELPKSGIHKPSHLLVEKADTNTLYQKTEDAHLEQKPAVSHMLPSEPAPSQRANTGIIKRLISSLFGASEEEASNKPATKSIAQTQEQKTNVQRGKQRSHGSQRSRHPKNAKGKASAGSGRRTTAPKKDTQASELQKELKTTQKHTTQDMKESQKAPKPPNRQAQDSDIPIALDDTTSDNQQVNQPTQIPTAPAVSKSESKVESKPRTRRGTRGGRRRNNPNFTQKQASENDVRATSTLPQSTPEHLPPFPTDLESYYKENLKQTGSKPQKPNKTPANTPVKENESKAGENKQEQAKPVFAETAKLEPIKQIIPQENAAPIVVKPTPVEPKKTTENQREEEVVPINVKVESKKDEGE
jgi:ribonuclease E